MKDSEKNIPYSLESDDFIKNETQFRLGDLITEQSHPVTKDLSFQAAKDTLKGLELINKVDFEIPAVFLKLADERKLDKPIEEIVKALNNGGKIFFTGCGATGRLSIHMEAVWRGFWQEVKRKKLWKKLKLKIPRDIENRIFSIMAGGDFALIKSVENYEDQMSFGKKQINDLGLKKGDIVFAVTEGGETSFVIGTAWAGVEKKAKVFFIYNNPDNILCSKVERSRKVIEDNRICKINMTTGPQAITGSTRMQAASIETLILSCILEIVLLKILSPVLDKDELLNLGFNPEIQDIGDYAEKSKEIPLIVKGTLPALAEIVEIESKTYSEGGNFYVSHDPFPQKGYTLYVGGSKSGLVILTDTTERSPTFYTPPFKQTDNLSAKSSPVYILIDAKDNQSAWRKILKRQIRGIDWNTKIYRNLLNEEGFDRIKNNIPKISKKEILKFIIGGSRVLRFRPIGKGNFVVGVFLGNETDALLKKSFIKSIIEKSKKKKGRTALIIVTSGKIDKKILPKADKILIIDKIKESPLNIVQTLVLKILLNTLSTMVMVKLGRVRGNFMTYVSPSNKKLVDRATRIVKGLTGVSYETANHYIFDILKETKDARKKGVGLPAPCNIAIVRIILGIDTKKAIEVLSENKGLLKESILKK